MTAFLLLFSCSVVSDFVKPWTAASQASLSFTISQSLLKLMSIESVMTSRLLCPSPSPRACSNSCLLSQWCHSTISSSVIPFSSCLQSSPASGSFPMSQFFASGGKIIGASASASVLPMNIQDWFPLGFIGLVFLQSKGLSRVYPNTTVQKYQFFGAHPFYDPTLTWLLGKNITLTIWNFVGKVMSLLFNMLFRFLIPFLQCSKFFLILWLQSPSAMIWSPRK